MKSAAIDDWHRNLQEATPCYACRRAQKKRLAGTHPHTKHTTHITFMTTRSSSLAASTSPLDCAEEACYIVVFSMSLWASAANSFQNRMSIWRAIDRRQTCGTGKNEWFSRTVLQEEYWEGGQAWAHIYHKAGSKNQSRHQHCILIVCDWFSLHKLHVSLPTFDCLGIQEQCWPYGGLWRGRW